MTANNTSRRLAFLAAVLSLLMLLSFAVLPGFAAEESTGTEATVETETDPIATETEPTGTQNAETSTGASTEKGTAASTEKATGTSTGTSTGTAATTTGGMHPKQVKGLVINLSVGGVLILGLAALAFVFRKKIPTWIKALKSECGKVVWCPKEKLKKNAKVVLLTIIVLAAAIALMDFAFSRGIILLGELFH